MDAVKIGLLCITAICITIAVCAIFYGGDRAFEIALAALNGPSLIGGWLGKTAYDKIKEGE